MGNHEKAVLSKKNKYYISKHRYYELKHFCLQYNEWIEELKKLDSQGRRSSGGEIHSDPQFSDPTAEIAMRRSQLQQNIEIIKDAAVQTDRVLFNYLMLDDYRSTQRIIDEAKIKQIEYDREIRLKELALQEKQNEQKQRSRKVLIDLWIIASIIVVIIVLGLGFFNEMGIVIIPALQSQ